MQSLLIHYCLIIIVGQLCELTETPTTSQNTRESCSSNLQDYLDTLSISSACATAQPGILVWTPDETTPDTVYYQVLCVCVCEQCMCVCVSSRKCLFSKES